jgi:outer membrane lipoprotein-sorting protein
MKRSDLFFAGLLITFLFMSVVLPAQEKKSEMTNPSLFRKNLTEATKKTNSIQSTFSQEKSLSVLSEKILSKGKFYFRKNNLLRWEYTYPFSYLIILNNGQILVRDEDSEKHFDAASNKVFGEINSILLGCAQGTLLNDEKKFQPSYFETSGNYIVRLQPRIPRLKEIFNDIWLYFDKKDYSVSKLIMNEPSGDFTTITFSEKKLNLPVPDEKFNTK